jgi:peptidoglycan/LPS O-acetylase OafA/YrhL
MQFYIITPPLLFLYYRK